MITIFGFLVFVVGLLFINLAKFLSYSTYFGLSLIMIISKLCSSIPYATIVLPTISFKIIIAYYLLVIYYFANNIKLKKYLKIIIFGIFIL